MFCIIAVTLLTSERSRSKFKVKTAALKFKNLQIVTASLWFEISSPNLVNMDYEKEVI